MDGTVADKVASATMHNDDAQRIPIPFCACHFRFS
jgi:hypothetical protein